MKHKPGMKKNEREKRKKQCNSLDFGRKSLILRLPSFLQDADGGATFFRARADSGIQGVESGSSVLIMLKRCLGEFAPCSGVDSSFMFSSLSGFARTLLSENVDSRSTPSFLFPMPYMPWRMEEKHTLTNN